MIIQDLKYKAKLYYGECSARTVLRILLTDGTSAMVLFRIACFFRSIKLAFIGWGFLKINEVLNGCTIGRHTFFDEGFVIMHGHGIVINGGVRGGRNVVLASGVVIGTAGYGPPVKVPRLRDDISIGSGAKLLGDIEIGSHVTVGANAVVVDNVPDGATVVGIPARVIKVTPMASEPPVDSAFRS